jgi:hypothetical protein
MKYSGSVELYAAIYVMNRQQKVPMLNFLCFQCVSPVNLKALLLNFLPLSGRYVTEELDSGYKIRLRKPLETSACKKIRVRVRVRKPLVA